ncbi:hypothetical protein FB451DRAFT_975049, partial [Mycena latifolia]
EWAPLVPVHHGRVRLGSLPQEFDVGMCRDLRCLDTIWSALVGLRDGASGPSRAAEECLGQLRPAILCTADITLAAATVGCNKECQWRGER